MSEKKWVPAEPGQLRKGQKFRAENGEAAIEAFVKGVLEGWVAWSIMSGARYEGECHRKDGWQFFIEERPLPTEPGSVVRGNGHTAILTKDEDDPWLVQTPEGGCDWHVEADLLELVGPDWESPTEWGRE